MTRRKLHYQQYPEIAARVSPEERGEDTERTIFNPQDCISLSLEYVRIHTEKCILKLGCIGPAALQEGETAGMTTADDLLGHLWQHN
ncbi:unnamed protein product [Acanthoscelides obtectus]|uniref:Uncharacterized protein n=1 Tax=Acanthoscelides obtectus TaxID=200917 RepID=A0A9P0MA04_ACAOB|nr:unnamed protein product [Acanthoscelides obtectus]CAK1664672.1 Polycomb group protein Psc [Acanthoscelides obtectus]